MTEWLHFNFSLSCIGEGNGSSLQCSFLGNPRDGGAWWAAIYGVAQSRTRLKWLSSSSLQFSSVQCLSYVWLFTQSCLYGLQHTRLPYPSPTPGTYSNSCPLSQWCHPTISSSVFSFSSCLQSFPASGSFPVSQFFTSGGRVIGVSASASVLPMNIRSDFL